MKKKRLIILITVVIITWIWTTYFFCIKQQWQSKTESECQNFIDECCKRKKSYLVWGWMMVFETHDDWRTNIDDECENACPNDCNRYTEERWYFKDKKRQKKYYESKVKECKNECEECVKNSNGYKYECHECDKYWQPKYLWN